MADKKTFNGTIGRTIDDTKFKYNIEKSPSEKSHGFERKL